METQKVVNLLNGSDNEKSKFATKKWHVIDSESKGNYLHKNEIKFLTNLLESNLCDYSDAYILVTGNTTVTRRKIIEQKSVTLLLVMQILLILQCLCTI